MKARDCTKEDFGKTEKDQKLFSDWNGFRLYCPEIPKDKDLFLEGKQGAMESSEIVFYIKRCTGKAYCKNETTINDYIKDLTVDFWTL